MSSIEAIRYRADSKFINSKKEVVCLPYNQQLDQATLRFLKQWLQARPGDLEPMLVKRKQAETAEILGRWNYVYKYMIPSLLSKIPFVHVSWRKLEQLRTDLCNRVYDQWTLGDVDKREKYLRATVELWPEIRQKCRKNRGLYKFLRDYGVNDPLLIAYIFLLSPGYKAMEFHLGYTFDLFDQYVQVTPLDVMAYYMVMHESTAVSFTWRDYLTKREQAKYVLRCGYKPTLVVLAAGAMTEWRDFGWVPELCPKIFGRIEAYDRDLSVPDALQKVYKKPISEYGINYHVADVSEAFADETLHGKVDIISMKGFMSYHHFPRAETLHYLQACKEMLKPGGIVTFDLQVMEPEMLRCGTSLGWGGTSLFPDFTPGTAIKRVYKAAAAVGLEVQSVDIDPSKKITFVQFCLRKPR